MMGFLHKTLDAGLMQNHLKTIVFIWVYLVLFWASIILFTLFLWTGSLSMMNLGLSPTHALVFDAFLSLLFFLQHSIMIRPAFKKWLSSFIPDIYHLSFYGFVSTLALLSVILFWQKSTVTIAAADGAMSWLMRVLFGLCLAGFAWGSQSLGSFDVLGVKALLNHIRNRPASPQQMVVRGPYRWVRHPLYLFSIILLWSCPVLSADRLIFNILWTAWIIVGTFLEDRDLHREFGISYRQYSERVPMLIPYRIPTNKP